MLVSGIAVAAPADKVDVCHLEGNGSYHKISVSDNAYDSHIAHGDAAPGDPVPGMTGYVFGEDCEPELAAILVVSSLLNFSGTGGGGWSCPPEYPNVIDGGVSQTNTQPFVPAAYPVYQVAAVPGATLTSPYGTWTYPVFAHYIYGSWYPGETGWAVVNGGTAQSLYVYVYCVE
jgi:hypothetical protein